MTSNVFSLVFGFFPLPTYVSTQHFLLNSRKLLCTFPFVFFSVYIISSARNTSANFFFVKIPLPS